MIDIDSLRAEILHHSQQVGYIENQSEIVTRFGIIKDSFAFWDAVTFLTVLQQKQNENPIIAPPCKCLGNPRRAAQIITIE